jgi:nucleotide-binding universal stress UspA family protein
MTRSIVCGIDETTGSRHAAAIAARLARDLDSRPILVHVAVGGGFLQRVPLARLGRRRRMRRTLKEVADEHSFPAGTDRQVKAGDPPTTLIAVARREGAELIVVGAGGEWSVSAALLGSVSSALMRDAPCPVILVPSDTVAPLDAEGMRSVVCGVAGEETDPALLRLAADLANRLGGELHAVHAYNPGAMEATGAPEAAPPAAEPRQTAAERLAHALEEAGVDAQASVLPLPATQALETVADEHRAGLIVVGSRGPSQLGSFHHGPVPTQLSTQGRTAVVVLPLGARLEAGSGYYELVAGTA